MMCTRAKMQVVASDALGARMCQGSNCSQVGFSELKIPYDTVLAADFVDLECAVSAKSR